MSLRDKYKTDSDAVRAGVWFEFDANPDGTVPAFKLAFIGKSNKRYTAAVRKWTARFEDENGVPDFANLAEEEADQALLAIFADTVLLDWRNFQPEEDGINLEYSREAVLAVFGSDDWSSLYQALNQRAKKVAAFKQKSLEAQAKN